MKKVININKTRMPYLLLATTNSGKLKELRSLLGGLSLHLVSPSDLGIDINVQETGSTYAENATLKAVAFQEASGIGVLADDTGLEVDALLGAPGLHSARYSQIPGATDADRRKKLLDALREFPRPWTARFRCVVAVAIPGVRIQLFNGSVEGEIISHESGDHGFGYDRIFWIPQARRTLADLDLNEKNKYSHRAMAVGNAIPYLLQMINSSKAVG